MRASLSRSLAVVLLATALGSAPARATVAAATRCRASDADPHQPTGGRAEPPPAPVYFAKDFPRLADDLWPTNPVGGFGGLHRRARLTHTPVVFVHGNQGDGQVWLDTMLQFQNDARYSMQEMYAVSYNGLENYAGNAPTQIQPTEDDRAYQQQHPTVLATDGKGSADDDEVPDLCRFVQAVQDYTGSRQIDIVAHSLGVTIARKMMVDYPTLARDVVAFVGVAGANHGTSICRGIETTYYGCNEIVPGSSWLDRLNGLHGSRETYGPTAWMTIYDGAAGDPYYNPPSDEASPHLRGARNVTFAGTYHNDLRVGPAEVDTYLPFLLAHGQEGPGADPSGPLTAARITAAQPDGMTGRLCGIPDLNGGC